MSPKPVPLTYDSVVGELQRGLGGYLYVKCSNIECAQINIVPHGKTHRAPGSKGSPTFAVNTKLGTGVGHDEEPDIEKVPDAVPRGVFKPVTLQTGHDPTLVMFDLETTDLIRGQQIPHITQMSAVTASGDVFNTYVTPKVPISISASRLPV